MSDLIRSLQIFLKYGDPHYPTNCDHDLLFVCVDPSLVSEDDKRELERLSFSEIDGGFGSTRFGSA